MQPRVASRVDFAMRALFVIVALLLAQHASAERRLNDLGDPVRRTPLSWSDIPVMPRRVFEDRHRVHVGAALATGWVSMLDLSARYFATDRLSMALRMRIDLEGKPRADELEVGYTFGIGKLLLFDELMLRMRMLAFAGAGVATLDDAVLGLGFAGTALQIRFPCGFAIELGARASYAPVPVDVVAARGTVGVSVEHGLAGEVFAGIVIPLPGR